MGNNLAYKGLLSRAKMINGNVLEAYIPSATLVEAVNLALLLKKRPLLLMGEPGCGKTRLAEAVAYEIHGEDYQNYYFEWNIKSTSRAKDGLYRYDALRRLNDVQINANKEGTKIDINDLRMDIEGGYIKSGELGKAFQVSKPGKPAVVLIDEIDKADIDFPNDLLLELDKNEFIIEETGEKIPKADEPPLIFITSNGEKELPSAFLRRCLFHYIKFPDNELLKRILLSHFAMVSETIVVKAVNDFINVRERLSVHVSEVDKKVSTSELIDWFAVITEVIELKKKKKLDEAQKQFLRKIEEWENSADLKLLPFHQVLLKNLDTLYLFKELINEIN